jgi:hypothetical protein
MLSRVWIPSPNYSQRSGRDVRLIVLHTAEGARTIESLGGFFQGNVQASSHVGADDKVNTIGEYVKAENKAWTQSAYNSAAVSMELCAFSAWDRDEWMRHPNMLDNCAKWISEEAAYFKIPIRRLTPTEAQSSGRGVCQHVDLGRAGGGHHDCGPDFPMDYVLTLATGAAEPQPPTELPEDPNMITAAVNKKGNIEIFVEDKDGSIWHTWQKDEGGWQGAEPGKVTGWQGMGNPGKK